MNQIALAPRIHWSAVLEQQHLATTGRWGRLVYVTRVHTGMPSFLPCPQTLSDPSQVSRLTVSGISRLDLRLFHLQLLGNPHNLLFQPCLKPNSLLLGKRNVGKCQLHYCFSVFPNFCRLNGDYLFNKVDLKIN